MDNQLFTTLDELLASSENLLKLAGEEAWGEFNDGVERYLPAMQALAAVDFSRLDAFTRQQAVKRIEALMANDVVVMQRMRARLTVLSQEMACMRKSNASAQAYRAV